MYIIFNATTEKYIFSNRKGMILKAPLKDISDHSIQ